MKKILILSSFPASYRVDVFKGLAKHYDITVFFGSNTNDNRNADWFVKDDELKYYLISTEQGKLFADECFKNLKRFDLVLGYDWYQTWALKFELKAFLLRIPYIINCDGAFEKSRFELKDIIKRFFISNAAACFAGGEYAKRYFMHYGAKENNIFIHNFTSLHQENILSRPYSSDEKIQLRKELGLSDKRMVLSIGQFIPRKGFDILLDAWALMVSNDVQLVIIGGGNLRQEYEKTIADKNIINVKIIDFVPFGQIFKYYMAADVFALATREDIWGLIVNESMANGIPVLISDKCVAGMELVENGETGFIIKDNDLALWQEKLDLLLNNDELRSKMSHIALSKIQNWTIEHCIEENLNTIGLIIGK